MPAPKTQDAGRKNEESERHGTVVLVWRGRGSWTAHAPDPVYEAAKGVGVEHVLRC